MVEALAFFGNGGALVARVSLGYQSLPHPTLLLLLFAGSSGGDRLEQGCQKIPISRFRSQLTSGPLLREVKGGGRNDIARVCTTSLGYRSGGHNRCAASEVQDSPSSGRETYLTAAALRFRPREAPHRRRTTRARD